MIKKNLKIAVFGAGYMGQNHARILSLIPNVSLVAICDQDREKADLIANQYKIKSYNDIEELLKMEETDAVTICLPTVLHFKAASLAIKRKLAVFIEKPISANSAEAKKLVLLVNKTKSKVMVGHIERFNPVVNEIKQRIKAGELGKIIKIHTQRFSPPPGRGQDVSAVVDLATHDIDVIQYLIGQKPVRLYSETDKKVHSREDLMTALIRFDKGVIGVVEVSWLQPTKVRNLTVLGENGMYVANYITQELLFFRQNENLFNNGSYFTPSTITRADVVKIAFEAKEPLFIELSAFVNSVLNGTPSPVSVKDGETALIMAEKMIKSGHNHKILK